MKKHKVLLVITQGDWGGAQRYVFDLATNLDQEKFEVGVAFGNVHRGELITKLETRGILVYPLKYLRRSFNPLINCLFIVELAGLLKKLSPDTVHFNSTNAGVFGPIAVYMFKYLNFKKDVKVIYTAHGFPFNEPGILRKFIFTAAEKFASWFRNLTICVSRFDHHSAVRRRISNSSKLSIVHNGIDANNFRLLPGEEARKLFSSVPREALLIGTVSQFYKNKGLEYLVAAARLVIQKHPRVFFAIVGGGPEEHNLKSRIKDQGLENKFFILPYQENGSGYLNAFDIIAAPSVKEGLPYFLLEAALAKKAIVSTSVGGIPEIIEHGKNGLLVQPGNHEELAKAILRLVTSPVLRNHLGENAYQLVSREFTLKKMVAETEKTYLEIDA